MALGFVLEKLGLQSLLGTLRLLVNGVPPFKDPSILIQNQDFDEVPVRIYQSKKTGTERKKAVLFFHGGAGTFGSIDAYERICRHIAKETDSVVVAVGYHVAPENPYPNQYTECLKATVHLMKNSEAYQVDSSRVILSGDSFGATLATYVCQLLVNRQDLPKLYAQVLIYPALQGIDFSLPSYQQNRRVPLLWSELIAYFGCRFLNTDLSILNDILKNCHVPEAIRLKYRKWVSADLIPEEFKVRGYKPEDFALRQFKPKVYEEMKQVFEVSFSPLLAEDAIISKLPQTCLVTCEFDPLRDDGLLYKKRLEDHGVPVTWLHIKDGGHGMAVLFGYGVFSLPSAERIVRDTTTFIKNV
ncbi:arylacetamide deacetylase-like 3 [Tiliqua scincoides]|uniref:arylacetamide deacetylase-like 3 n=1 Tax=Tiliqua scincoides TaxID=71010 RepID=UPI0034624A81